MNKKKFLFSLTIIIFMAVFISLFSFNLHAANNNQRPIIFVHGAAGSLAQFENQAKRFASNGYPMEYIDGIEYDYSFEKESQDQVLDRLENKIKDVLKETGSDKVDLVAHSLGTYLCQSYLNDSLLRSWKIAHYVNLDGMTAFRKPGRVPTLAIWGEGLSMRKIIGASNIYQKDQSHTQTVTSEQSFIQMYKFFNGKTPATTNIISENKPIRLSGKIAYFPSNIPANNVKVEIYEINSNTGVRLSSNPLVTLEISKDGSFGPFTGKADARYEFAINQENGQVNHHYYQPFLRSDKLIRLFISEPSEGIGAKVPISPNHSALLLTRYKEWWGDKGNENDVVNINGKNIITASTAPNSRRVIGLFVHDQNSDKITNLNTEIKDFAKPFISAADVYIPASSNASGSITIEVESRAGGGVQKFVVPNWPSDRGRITVNVNDL